LSRRFFSPIRTKHSTVANIKKQLNEFNVGRSSFSDLKQRVVTGGNVVSARTHKSTHLALSPVVTRALIGALRSLRDTREARRVHTASRVPALFADANECLLAVLDSLFAELYERCSNAQFARMKLNIPGMREVVELMPKCAFFDGVRRPEAATNNNDNGGGGGGGDALVSVRVTLRDLKTLFDRAQAGTLTAVHLRMLDDRGLKFASFDALTAAVADAQLFFLDEQKRIQQWLVRTASVFVSVP
jgi:hypothetical protein